MATINAALAFGKNLILTPGVYNLTAPILVTRPDTVVLGLGFATIVPQHGNVGDAGRQRAGREALRHHLRRRAGELAGAACRWVTSLAAGRQSRPIPR